MKWVAVNNCSACEWIDCFIIKMHCLHSFSIMSVYGVGGVRGVVT